MPARDVIALLAQADWLKRERLAWEAQIMRLAVGTAIATAFGAQGAEKAFEEMLARLAGQPTAEEVLRRVIQRAKEKEHG